MSHLVELAELLSIPVVQQINHVNFPTDHPLYVGYQTVKHAKNADVLFFIDIDVPWEPPSRSVSDPASRSSISSATLYLLLFPGGVFQRTSR